VPGEAPADKVTALSVGDDVVELEPDPFQGAGPGVNEHRLIVTKGLVIIDVDLDNGIEKAALLDFTVGIGHIPHELGPAILEITQVIGVVDYLGAIRIRIEGSHGAPMPDSVAVPVPDKPGIVLLDFGQKGFRSHLTLL